MRAKNIIAGLLVSVVSIGLAIGITFIVQSSNNVQLTLQTPSQNGEASEPTSTPVPGIASIIIDGTILPTSAYNCTFPLQTWLQFPGAWRIGSYRIGDRTYTRADMTQTLGISNGDIWDRALAQIFATVLNQQNGADVTSVRAAFGEAVSWIQRFPRGSNPTSGDIQQIENVIKTLTRFNTGEGALPGCQYDLSRSTAVVQPTLPPGVTATYTLTPSPIVTRRVVMPTWTKEPSHNDPRPTKVPASPLPPTAIPPTAVPPTPVQPTDVFEEPTDAPPPTDVPPPTVGATVVPATDEPPSTAPSATARKTKKPRGSGDTGLLFIDPAFFLVF